MAIRDGWAECGVGSRDCYACSTWDYTHRSSCGKGQRAECVWESVRECNVFAIPPRKSSLPPLMQSFITRARCPDVLITFTCWPAATTWAMTIWPSAHILYIPPASLQLCTSPAHLSSITIMNKSLTLSITLFCLCCYGWCADTWYMIFTLWMSKLKKTFHGLGEAEPYLETGISYFISITKLTSKHLATTQNTLATASNTQQHRCICSAAVWKIAITPNKEHSKNITVCVSYANVRCLLNVLCCHGPAGVPRLATRCLCV